MDTAIKITRKISGFGKNELISIAATDYFDAFSQFGKKTSRIVRSVYQKTANLTSKKDLPDKLKLAQKQFNYLKKLSRSPFFTLNSVNYLQNYLDSFHGYCQGTGLSESQMAFLQSEIDLGCQSIIVQDRHTKAVNLIHVEEDASFSRFDSKSAYRFRLVKMALPSKTIRFFSYPELAGWGPAISINETTGLVQVIIDLCPDLKKEFKFGYLFASAVAFMAIDCGSVESFKKLLTQIRQIPRLQFNGGYSMHLAQTNSESPQIFSVEFIHNQINFLAHHQTNKIKYLGQSNYPNSNRLKQFSAYTKPLLAKKWEFDNTRLFVEMDLRYKRLNRQAKDFHWDFSSPKVALTKNLQLLADPSSDICQYQDAKNKTRYYYSCLPSKWAVSHIAVLINKNQLDYHLGKLTPKPINNNPYTLKYKPDFPYEANITTLTQKLVTKNSK